MPILIAKYIQREFNLAGATQTGSAFSLQDSGNRGLEVSADGTKMYSVDTLSGRIYEYDLSSSWDLSTAAYNSAFKDVSGQSANPQSIAFKPDGTKMYMQQFASTNIHEYDLGVAWDITSAVYNSVFFGGVQGVSTRGIEISSDGLRLFTLESVSNTAIIYQYDLGVAWDISSAVYNSQSIDITSPSAGGADIHFTDGGSKMIVTGVLSTLFRFDLGTPWDITTAVYNGNFINIQTTDTNPQDAFLRPDGLRMFVSGTQSGSKAYQFDM